MQTFLDAYDLTDDAGPGEGDSGSPAVDAFLTEYGGRTFRDGLYRTLRLDQAAAATAAMQTAFPEQSERAVPFGYDWLGRIFAVADDDSECLICELGAGGVLAVPAGLAAVHEVEAVEHPQDLFAADFFAAWRATGEGPLARDECAAYRVPLYLGGADEVANLARFELAEYWEAAAAMWAEVRDLPEGAEVRVEGLGE